MTVKPERKKSLQKRGLWLAVAIPVTAVIIVLLIQSALLDLGAGLFAAGVLIFTAQSYRRPRQSLEATQQDRLTGCLTKAIGKLSSKRLQARIGGVYALERVALGSPRDHPTVMEALAAFIREYSREKWPPLELAADDDRNARTTRPDVQAAVTVIGRRNHGNDCQPVNLNRADLTAADLTAANLTDTQLCAANLTNANLTNANLDCANLRGANLWFTLLAIADLTNADLTNVTLTAADLTNTDLANAELTDANLVRANLPGAQLVGANLTEVNLRGANLCFADLTNADLTNANLTNTDLTNAELTDANLVRANLRGAQLVGANLTEVNLRGANLCFADLTNADLTNANLTNTDLTNTDLTNALWPRESPMPKGWALKSGARRLGHAGADPGSPG